MTVPAGKVLKIEPGTVVLMNKGASIVVEGQLLAEGTRGPADPLSRISATARPGSSSMFVEAADSRFDHCIFEYADSAGDHQDYYVPGPQELP